MLRLALVCVIASVICAVFGFGGASEGFADVAKILFGVFLVVALVLVVLGYTAFKKVT